MKTKKTFSLLAACLVMTVAVVNVRLATAKHEAVSKLVQSNVQAKAIPTDMELWLIRFIYNESQLFQEKYYEYLEMEGSCVDETVARGTYTFGSTEGSRMLAALNIDPTISRHVRRGSVDTNVTYEVDVESDGIYTFTYRAYFIYEGDDWLNRACKVVDKYAPNAIKGCQPFDGCLDVIQRKGGEFKLAVGLA